MDTVETEDERYERLRTTRERMAISSSQDTEERRYCSETPNEQEIRASDIAFGLGLIY